MHKVVITDFIADELAPERAALAGLASVEAFDAHHEDQFVGRIEDAAAIMMYHNIRLTRRTIERLTQCRLIVRCGVGFDNVDHAFARERGIWKPACWWWRSAAVAFLSCGMALD